MLLQKVKLDKQREAMAGRCSNKSLQLELKIRIQRLNKKCVQLNFSECLLNVPVID